MIVPEPLVVRDPVPHRTETLGDKAVAALPPVPLFGDEADFEEDAQMLRDGRAAHLEVRCNFVDWSVAVGEQVEHTASGRVTDRSKDLAFALGCRHTVTIMSK